MSFGSTASFALATGGASAAQTKKSRQCGARSDGRDAASDSALASAAAATAGDDGRTIDDAVGFRANASDSGERRGRRGGCSSSRSLNAESA